MNLYNFRSEMPKNPFAPKYNYFFCSENCFDLLDIKKITFIVLKKEKLPLLIKELKRVKEDKKMKT